MSLKQIMEQNPNVQLVVTASDLRELFNDWQAENRAQLEAVKASSLQLSDDRLLTAKEAREQMRLSQSTLWKLEKQKMLAPIRIGRRVFYRRSDVDEIMSKKKGE